MTPIRPRARYRTPARAAWRAGFRLWAVAHAVAAGTVALVALVCFVIGAATVILWNRAVPAARRFWREWLTPSARELAEFAPRLVADDAERWPGTPPPAKAFATLPPEGPAS